MITPRLDDLDHVTAQKVRIALDKQLWKEERPGVSIRKVKLWNKTYTQRKWECQVCRKAYYIMAFLKDALWKKIAPKDGMMCIVCMELKLGRKLVEADLKRPEQNYELAYLLNSR